jgi:hypothetical protein
MTATEKVRQHGDSPLVQPRALDLEISFSRNSSLYQPTRGTDLLAPGPMPDVGRLVRCAWSDVFLSASRARVHQVTVRSSDRRDAVRSVGVGRATILRFGLGRHYARQGRVCARASVPL